MQTTILNNLETMKNALLLYPQDTFLRKTGVCLDTLLIEIEEAMKCIAWLESDEGRKVVQGAMQYWKKHQALVPSKIKEND